MIKPWRDCFNVSVREKAEWFKAASWDGELGAQARLALEQLLQGALAADVEQQLGGVAPYQRGPQRRDQRNGSYRRRFETEQGTVELRVPRSRHNVYQPRVFARYQRRAQAVDQAICQMFCRGISTREVGEVLQALIGTKVSATTVSEVTRRLDQAVQAFQQRPLSDQYRYLLLDAVYLGCKGAAGRRRVAVLVAYGIRWDGRRELIAFRQAKGESERDWTMFLEDLRRRGLEGRRLQLIVTDGAPGLIAALDLVFPYVRRQCCWVHKLRNVARYLRARHRDECLAQAKAIYRAATRREARQRFRAWKGRWKLPEPKAVACLTADLEELLSFLDLPEPHRSKVRTTNALERAFREVRRRTNPMSCFNNPASLDRIVYAVVEHLNARWEKTPLHNFTQKT